MRKHIELYVNDYSFALGVNGKKAVERMHEFMMAESFIKSSDKALFV